MNRLFFIFAVTTMAACNSYEQTENKGITFSSSDSSLTYAFNWAKQKALSYVGDSTDESGPWYEAALPNREAFCMRDVSHQCIAAEYLGLHKQNLNMMRLFVQNISESKDWCSFWEINRNNKPAPADYRNDKEFWYNLPANFDLVKACYRLFKLSGDRTYIDDPVFLNFYRKTANEYIDRWQLNAGQLLSRDRYLNTPKPINMDDNFHVSRGLPSYIENDPNLCVGSDLIAAIYGGLKAYSQILNLGNNQDSANFYLAKASEYQQLLDSIWWDEKNKAYYSYSTINQTFECGAPLTFLLWFESVQQPDRINYVIDGLSDTIYNIENTSYLPYLFYKHGRSNDAYKVLKSLVDPTTKRRDYPEVSFGVIHGIVEGLLGIETDFNNNTLILKSNLTNQTAWAQIENMEVLSTNISVKHSGNNETIVSNSGDKLIRLKVCFPDTYSKILVNNKLVPVMRNKEQALIYSLVDCTKQNKLIFNALEE